MRCPYCGSLDDKVIESRTIACGDQIRRRRECISCGSRFTSKETIEEKPLNVVKKDGTRQPFDIAKVEKSIRRAAEKRSVTSEQLDSILEEIENAATIKGKSTNEITTNDLGELVMEQLAKVDKVAYIRFASVYKHFENLDEFIEEVKNIK